MNRFFSAACLLAGLALAPALSQAQTTLPAPDYTGPRYPGGPDSLRALVYRSTRLLAPSLAGRTVVQFELKDGQQPVNFKVLGPQRRAKSDLGLATQASIDYLQARMQPWQPAPPGSTDKPGRNPHRLLALNFAAIAGAQPYVYADQEPTFSYVQDMVRNNPNFRNNPEGEAILAQMVAANGLASYVQRHVRYPVQALRNREQGRITVYFEVAESGAVENAEIIGSAGGNLDTEVLRAVKALQPASTPALLGGRPVRVFYVLPIVFKVM